MSTQPGPMWGPGGCTWILAAALTVILTQDTCMAAQTKVYRIWPHYGSHAGSTRITIYGTGFSPDPFSFGQGNSNKGNLVKLVSQTRSYDCDPHPNGNTPNTITCDTKIMARDDYYVRISVDGNEVPVEDHCSATDPMVVQCRFSPHGYLTPTVTSLDKSSNFPGELVTICGRILTSRFGSNVLSTNDRQEKILRVYAGGQLCDLMNRTGSTNKPYDIHLDNGGSATTGCMTCKMLGAYVGNLNISYILEVYGRSDAHSSMYRVTGQDRIAMFQTYAEVNTINPSTGSEEGGTRLTITGRFFDQTDAPARIDIGGTPCEVDSMQDTVIYCVTAAKPASLSSMDRYPGNRGADFGIYTDSSLFDDFPAAATKTEAPGNATVLDELKWNEVRVDNYLARMMAFFMPPRTGGYRFHISWSDDESKLYFSETGHVDDLMEISTRGTGLYGNQKLTLQAGKAYPLIHVTRERGGNAGGQVAVHMSNTSLPCGRITPNVYCPIQDIITTSVILNEIQTVKFSGWSAQTHVSEVQCVTVLSDNPGDVKLRLGMGGVWTAPLRGTEGTSTVKAEVEALPSIAPSSVTVSKESISGGQKFCIIFASELGDMDMLTAVIDEPTNRAVATLTVEQTVQGRAAMSHFALTYSGSVSPPIALTASAAEVAAAVRALFEVRCPDFLSNPASTPIFSLDYESVKEYREFGTRVTDMEPFCGRTCVKNPSFLYYHDTRYKTARINLMTTGKVCFAYKGKLLQKIYVHHNYKTATNSGQAHDTFVVTIPESVDWSYICIDLKALLVERRTGVTEALVSSLSIYRDIFTTSLPTYLDNIMILREDPTSDLQGVAALLHQLRPPEWLLKDVSVTGDSTAGYRVDMTLRGCPHNLPFFSVLGAKEMSRNGTTSIVYDSTTWLSEATVTVERIEAATPPIDGTFTLSVGNEQLVFAANIDETDLKRKLEAVPGVGEVSVARTGTCAGYKWRVTWLTAPGHQDLVTVNGSSLTGNNVGTVVNSVKEGGVYYNPIPGDLLRTINDKPQVIVDINKIPSLCTGDCGFSWTPQATPHIDTINPTSGSNTAGTVVTLVGGGFSSTTSENLVLIGGVACTLISATSTQLQCSVGQGPAGPQDVIVNVDQKGLARNTNGVLKFTYNFAITSFSPEQGSIAGGVVIIGQGTGFSTSMSVTVGGAACPVLTAVYSSFTCRTPPGSAGEVDVVMTDGETNSHTSTTKFTYSTPDTPVVQSVGQTTFQVQPEQTITIDGSSFGTSGALVTLNEHAVAITTPHSDTQIQGRLPLLPPGVYTLRVYVPGKGHADTSTNNIGQITINLSITNVFPLSGSMEGGTTVTLTGTGLPTDTEHLEVTIGGRACAVSTTSSTQVTCTAPSTETRHHITNRGVHPEYGELYAWSHPLVEILVGDTVRWTWAAPVGTAVEYGVNETDSATGESLKANGFSSGTATATGAFQFTFTTAGTYHYWSGLVDRAKSKELRGIIKVLTRPAYSINIEVKAHGHSAIYNTASGVSDPTNSASCSPKYSDIAGCSETAPSTSGAGFHFAYLKCKTPIVSSISPHQGSAADTITITGSGFGSTACQNMVTIGDKNCIVISSSTTEISCTLDTEGDATIGIAKQVMVSIDNTGQALITEVRDIDRYFVLLPHITAISPAGGSVKGGTEVTITGSGFYGQVTVAVGSVGCVVKGLPTYTQIVCTTNTASAGTANLTVTVQPIPGQHINVLCQAAASCDFEFSTSLTPTISSMSPATISDSVTPVVISGTGFGSSSDDVTVVMGGPQVCHVTDTMNTAITCTVAAPVVGTHLVLVTVAGRGLADTNGVTLTVVPSISSMHPTSGSVNGGNVITFTGVGFKFGDTQVSFGSHQCSQYVITSADVKCKVPAGSEGGVVEVQVTSNSVPFPTASYTYAVSDTPTLDSLSTPRGKSGDSVTLTGTGFSLTMEDMEVTIDGAPCVVTSSPSSTSVVCTLGEHSAGSYPVVVTVAGKGIATSSLQFTYSIGVSSVTLSEGSYGGGQIITVAGVGFDESDTTVTVCYNPCVITGSVTPTQLTCITAARAIAEGDTQTACDVMVAVGDQEDALATSFTYKVSLTPTITDISPRRGGTGGGTSLTITGTGFGSDSAQVAVNIAGTTCTLVTVTATQVVCTTAPRTPSIQTKIQLNVGIHGIATQNQADFEYIDVWSSQFTWGGDSPPVAGDFAVVPADMTLLLDTDTPVLKMLLIQGGTLIFDEKDVELQAENILITDGGVLQVGTETAPFQHKAIITLYGHPRSQELPIYGTKTIAVREGTLDLHGKGVDHGWVLLGETVEAGESVITLQQAGDWKVSDYIVIGSTGDHLSQKENEMSRITAISNGGLTLTLDSPLAYQHLGETIALASGISFEARAPVGLLTRNILVRGSSNAQWADPIAACPDGFNPAEFATQTCFQGRFGEEMGSDEYGAQIMFHAPRQNENLVTGRIANIEMTYAGQAFRLGRYAIHFHLNGDMSGNYVKGSAIHHSFNRAVNIHGTHNVLIEDNVVYDIMGGAFFLEDGIETGNTFNKNLAVFVFGSSSLQNDDITPAAFWITNPNNIVKNNHAAGGSHFGFWYRMHKHPDGPSYNGNYCPQHVLLGIFKDNTAHSNGWFGLWIFKEYYPMEGGGCNSVTPSAAKFYSLIAWNNEKAAEAVSVGAIQLHGFITVNNLVGIEWKLLSNSHSYSEERGAMVKDSVIVAKVAAGKMDSAKAFRRGIISPLARGLLIKGVKFINFEGTESAAFSVAKVDGTSDDFSGGFTTKTCDLLFINSPNKIIWRWMHEGEFHDMDGSLTGITDGKAVPTSGILPNDKCTHNAAGMGINPAVPGSVCQADVAFSRFSFHLAAPESLVAKNVSFTNSHGSTISWFMHKRMTHKDGWMVLLPTNLEYTMEFVGAGHLLNISYSGVVYDLKPNKYVIIKQDVTQQPDQFKMNAAQNIPQSATKLTAASNNGDWYFDEANSMLTYMISGKTATRRKRSANLSPPEAGSVDRDITLDVIRCSTRDCSGSIDPNTVPPPTTRPADISLWSDSDTWEDGFPGTGDDVTVHTGAYIVADVALPVLGKLYIYGTLELGYDPGSENNLRDFTLSCTHIFIRGGRLRAGWEDNRYTGEGQIVLRGDRSTPNMVLPSGPNMGSKVIGVFGGLELHGIERAVTWTRLSQTAAAGSNTVTVQEAVDWESREEIIIASTGYSAWETELMKITEVSDDKRTLTLNTTLSHKHLVTTTDVGQGKSVTFAAEVGILTRNIKIIGAEYDEMYSEAFGARVIVGAYTDEGTGYKGYARLSNVEFVHSGQEGWTDEYDPRFSIAYLDVGNVDDVRPSYVKKCAFHNGFAPAVGTFGVNQISITDNVIYHTVGSSIQDSGIDNMFRRNLVSLMVNPGTYNGRDEERLIWDAGFDIRRATRPILTGNAVAGSERAGYWVDGEPCEETTERWADNTAHSVLIGVQMLHEDCLTTCSLLGNFTVYKAWDFGVYFQVKCSVKVVKLVSADNTMGIFPMVLEPKADLHLFANKYVEIKESTFICKTADFDCINDVMADTDRNIYWSENSRAWTSSSGGSVGIAVTTFSSAYNEAPDKAFTNIMAYPTIGGLTVISDTSFNRFQSMCEGKRDVILTTNPNNDDLQHPVRLHNIFKKDVDDDSLVWLHRANIARINPSDCVDMDCDGLKKVIIDDIDGTFLGSTGTVIADSAFEWGVNAKRGLGDYRIPKTLLTDTSGNKINVADVAAHRGIIRDTTCTDEASWQAYKCSGLDYEMLSLESMDDDTETRRLSPIVLVGDGYLDLINGPQDHGWCFGYTCQKRLSTFPIIVAMGKYFILHYTGTSPQHTRLRLLNSVDTQAFVIGIYYAIPQRLDVYVDDYYVAPNNTISSGNGESFLAAPTYDGQYVPDVTTGLAGTNYFEKSINTLYVLVRGTKVVEIKTAALIFVSFTLPPMTLEDFYGANLLYNLAEFLNIPASRIKIAKAVSESNSRRKRDTSFVVELEISNPPSDTAVPTTPEADTLSNDELLNISSVIVNNVQLGTLGSIINTTILDFGITEPVPAPDSSTWKTVVATSDEGEAYSFQVQLPHVLMVETEPIGLAEGNVLSVHPMLKFLDTKGSLVHQLGSKAVPWKVTATLIQVDTSYPQVSLTGDITVDFVLGYANYTSLVVDYSGTYRLEYRLSYPPEAASLFSAQSTEFIVTERTLALSLVSQDNDTTVSQSFSVVTEIVDAITASKVGNITWKGHTWMSTVSLYMPELYSGQLQRSLTVPIDPITGRATFTDLRVTSRGRYYLKLVAVSTPAEYNLEVVTGLVDAHPTGWVQPVVELARLVRLRFNMDYNTILSNGRDYLEVAIQNHVYETFTAENVTVGPVTFTEGSILASFVLEGSTAGVTGAVQGLHLVVSSGTFSFTFFGQTLTADTLMWVEIPDQTTAPVPGTSATTLAISNTQPVTSPTSSTLKTVSTTVDITTDGGQTHTTQELATKILTVQTEPVGLSEGNVLLIQPALKFLDRAGALVQQLGNQSAAWEVTATLVKVATSYPQVSLTGKTTVDFVLGYATYTNLAVDYSGTYRLNYRLSYPPEAVSLYSAQSAEFTVAERTLALSITNQHHQTTVGQAFSVIAEIIDAITADKVEKIAWKGHTWMSTVSLYMPELYSGQLQGSLTVPIDPITGQATFTDLRVTSRGRYYLKLVAVSTPAEYNLEVVTGLVDAHPTGWVQPVVEVSKVIKLLFELDYITILSKGRDFLEVVVQNRVYASFTSENVTVGPVTFTEGSIVASFVLEGSTLGVTSSVDSLHLAVSSGNFSFTFFGETLTADTVMLVDDVEHTTIVPVPDDHPLLSAGTIAAIVICSILVLIAVIIALVILTMKLNNKKKVDVDNEDPQVHKPAMNTGWVTEESICDVDPAAAPSAPVATITDTNNSPQSHRSQSLQELTLDSSNTTQPSPITEQDSEDEELEASLDTTRSISRPQSRPPSTPSVVWSQDNNKN